MPITDPKLSLYEQDFYLWIQKTVELLQQGELGQLDVENLIEEIDSMGKSQRRKLKTRLTVLIEHLLKLQYWTTEKEYNARGWLNTIVEQRRQIAYILADSPSLKSVLNDIFLDCYQDARRDTLRKYPLSKMLFPQKSPFSLLELLDPDFIPRKFE